MQSATPTPSHWIAAKRTVPGTTQLCSACHTVNTPSYAQPRHQDATTGTSGDEANGETTSEPQRTAEEVEDTREGAGEKREEESTLHEHQTSQAKVLCVLQSHRKRNGRKLCNPLRLKAFRLDVVVPQGAKRRRDGSPCQHTNGSPREHTGTPRDEPSDTQEHVPEPKVVEKVVTIVPFEGLGECAVNPPTFSQAPFFTAPLSDTETQVTLQEDDTDWRQQALPHTLPATEQHNTQQWASQSTQSTASLQKPERFTPYASLFSTHSHSAEHKRRYSEIAAKLERFQPITFSALVSYFNIQELRAVLLSFHSLVSLWLDVTLFLLPMAESDVHSIH